MAVSRTIEYVHVERLHLDSQNPRIGRDKRRANLPQDELLKVMSAWTLDELVDSFSEAGGFWTQDAMIVIDGPHRDELTVVEGNRRLAALKLLYGALNGEISKPPKWLTDRLEEYHPSLDDPIFTDLPVLRADCREDVFAYLGFRHVTGIQEWAPAEKAEFITKLVDEQGLTYKEIGKRIGMKPNIVRQNYIAFKLLLQIESVENFDWTEVEERFSVLFLSVRSSGTRSYLGINLQADTGELERPIPAEKIDEIKPFVSWVFGTKEQEPILKDSRDTDRFGEILGEPKAVEYLKTAHDPDFEIAYSLTQASADVVRYPLRQAARFVRLALAELPGRENDEGVAEEAWPIIEGGIRLARATGEPNLSKARDILLAA